MSLDKDFIKYLLASDKFLACLNSAYPRIIYKFAKNLDCSSGVKSIFKQAQKYVTDLKELLTELQGSKDWSGTLTFSSKVNLEGGPDYVSFLGDELDHGLNPFDS